MTLYTPHPIVRGPRPTEKMAAHPVSRLVNKINPQPQNPRKRRQNSESREEHEGSRDVIWFPPNTPESSQIDGESEWYAGKRIEKET